MRFYQIFIFMIISLFIAGCTSTSGGINAQALIQANEQVDTLLEEYPNASLDVTYYSQNESSQLREEYNSICNKEFSQKALYRFSLQDESQNLDVVGYLDLNEQAVECLSREGNKNSQNYESSNSSETSMMVNSTVEEFDLYYTVEAKYEGVEPTQEQKQLLEELKKLTSNHGSAFKLEFEIEYENNEITRKEEGIVDSDQILDKWSELLSQITLLVENSSKEAEVKIEVAKEKVKKGENGENSFEIKVESNDDVKNKKENNKKDSQEIEIELEINKDAQSARAEVEINDEEEVMKFNTTSLEEIKQKIASRFNLEYGVVASNTEIEYEYSDDKEEKNTQKGEKEEIKIKVKVDKNSQNSQAEVEYNNEEFNLEFDTISLEEIKQKIASEFDVSYVEVASNTEVEYKNKEEDSQDKELENKSSQK